MSSTIFLERKESYEVLLHVILELAIGFSLKVPLKRRKLSEIKNEVKSENPDIDLCKQASFTTFLRMMMSLGFIKEKVNLEMLPDPSFLFNRYKSVSSNDHV